MTWWLLLGLVAWPLFSGSVAAIWPMARKRIGLIGAFGTLLFAGLLAAYAELGDWWLGGWAQPLGIGWRLDEWSLAFILMTALIGGLLSIYAWVDKKLADGFWPLWLGAWGAMNALYVSADVFNVYVTLELLGLTAVALVALNLKLAALQAAMRYLLVSLLGSVVFLFGVVLLYGQYGVLDMRALSAQMQPGLVMSLALALMTLGLMAKTALFPLHSWLPLAHGHAEAVVSAILSALVIKASFYLLMRLWLEVFAPLTSLSMVWLWAFLGSVAVFWGAWQALQASHLKRLVAWSTVAQVGYLIIGLALAAHPQTPPEYWFGLLWLVLAHALAKAAMFLAAGSLQQAAGHDVLANLGYALHRSRMTTFSFAMAGVSLAGLPISAGFLAKWWLLELGMMHQAWWWLLAVLLLGSLMTAAYVFRVLNLAFASQSQPQSLLALHPLQHGVALVLALLAIVLGVVGQGLWGG